MILCSLSFLVGCSKADNQAGGSPRSETSMASAADTAAASPMASLGAVAGKWQTRAISETGATLGTAQLMATPDTTGWTLTFPKQKPVPVRVVAVGGDSIVTASQYQDFENKKAQIRNRAVLRFHGEKMTGILEGHILIGGSDSLIHARLEGTREP
ncbi:MAG: hypothetical protein ACJ8CN_07785 [Gemmatimonadales bacterium]